MNITEANAVQQLLSWLLDPHADVAGPGAWERAREAAGNLADRAHARLGAGMQYLDVLEAWPYLLQGCAGCPDCAAGEDAGPLVETVPLAADGPL